MITVVDYGMGNIRSVVKAVERYTSDVQVSSDPESISMSRGIIMPGDGAFGLAMENLRKAGWIEPLLQFIKGDNFFMGICLGFQLLFSQSEEFGSHSGLDVIPGKVVRFQFDDMKVPHMGWNEVDTRGQSPFMKEVESGSYFYFIHSYYPVLENDDWVLGTTEYGFEFPCIVGKGNLIATQFHPEKSHSVGLKIVESFVRSVCL